MRARLHPSACHALFAVLLVCCFLGYVSAQFEESADYEDFELEPRDVDTTCSGSNYTTPDGLKFNVYCHHNLNAGNDSKYEGSESSLEDCLIACSTFRPKCFGVAFNTTTGDCWLKNETHPVNATTVDDAHCALVAPISQLDPLNTTCPFANNSIHTTSSGLNFSIDCGKDLPFCDYQPEGTADGIHTDTLEDCMEQCTDAHPLCRGLTWNPDLISGFSNCYLKKDVTDGNPSTDNGDVINHSAKAQLSATSVNSTCPSNTTYESTAEGRDKIFAISCNQGNDGTNLTDLHTDDITRCIDHCTTNSSCTAVVFDTLMENGFRNCYLKSTIGVSSSQPSYFFASLTGTVSNGTSRSSPSSHKSEGWIAGPVIGALVLIALLAALFWWWRGRKNKSNNRRRAAAAQQGADDFPKVADGSGSYYPVRTQEPAHEMDPSNPRPPMAYEMEQSKPHAPPTTYEMEGTAGHRHELHSSEH